MIDIGLPGIDGYELARWLRRQQCDATLIAITGYGKPGDRDEALAVGFDDHVVKPVELDTLGQILERVLAGGAGPE